MAMTQEQYVEWVVGGRLPRHVSGVVDVYKLERAIRGETSSGRVTGLLRRVAEARINDIRPCGHCHKSLPSTCSM